MHKNFFTAAVVSNLLNIIMGFIMLVLSLRVLLRFFNAGQAPFVRWVYETSEPLINPFRGMFPNPVLTGGNVLEVNTLIALLVYAFIGYLIAELLSYISYSTAHHHTS